MSEQPRTTNLIVFATDFGPGSEWVGICHAVVATINPAARIIDLAHDLPAFDARAAGQVLRAAMPYVPVSVAAFVVDPGVGTARRALAVRTGRGDVLIGPDNGLLPAAATEIGGISEARELTQNRFHRQRVSATFHARDIFCPVAAHLSAGVAFADIGTVVGVNGLQPAWQPVLTVRRGSVVCQVTNIDRFGNVRLSAQPLALEDAQIDSDAIWLVTPDSELAVQRARAFGDIAAGRMGLVTDSFGWLNLSESGGSAAVKLHLSFAASIELRTMPR